MITYKTPEEIEILKEGGRRHADILQKISQKIAPGVTAKELNEYAHVLIREYGDAPAFLHYTPEGAKRPYPAALCVSVNDEIVHGIPNEEEKVLKQGDVVSIDLGLIHRGLITDSAVTLPVGVVSETHMNLIRATEEALYAGIAEAKGGNRIGDIGFAVQSVAKKRGFALAEGLSGHGVGYAVHEDPFVPNTGKQGKGELLKPGMVIAIEPMLVTGLPHIVLDKDGYTYRTADKGVSAHAEHTIVITDNEPIILTNW